MDDLFREEMRQQKLEDAIFNMPSIGTCEFCKDEIRKSTADLWGDEYVEVEGLLIHWDCWYEYGLSHKKEG